MRAYELPETPAEAGVQGGVIASSAIGVFGPWVPACAGTGGNRCKVTFKRSPQLVCGVQRGNLL